MIILGIDPGTTTIGFSLIKKEKSKIKLIDYGIFKTTPKIELKYKIFEIGNDINEIIKKYNPDILSIEKLFFQTNTKTAIDVAQARGVIIYECIKNGLKIQEYTPLQVKKAITGNGKANKLQLQNAIKILFGLESIPKPDDAADAIGLAYIGALNSNQINNGF
ncbi:MAG: crossover junction endodeoxyribonuclease RuvC [Candidatus Gracilibacteria bacterium]|nr:crossover junction endodeoxyribonuclease RuvC [Candidatus Gracilibacteria bacterium]